MQAKLERGFAARLQPGTGPVERLSRTFTAPAAGELGGQITISVLADPVGSTKNATQASGVTVDTIQRYFTSHTTNDVFESISGAFQAANAAVLALKAPGASCSAVVVVCALDRLFVGSVGDAYVLIVRDNQIKTLAPNQTWVHEARRTWNAASGDLPERIEPESHNYVGTTDRVEPVTAPVEFVWPGDAVLICTAALASHQTDSRLRAILSRSPDAAAAELVNRATRDGVAGNLAALVLTLPGSTSLVPVKTPSARPLRRHSAIPALILINLLLVCLIAAMLMRGGGLGTLFAPSPTVEVARPAFVTVPTPTPGLDIGPTSEPETDPFAAPPPAVTAPAAAPTLTAVPTFTPRPVTSSWQNPPAPSPVEPTDGYLFGGPGADVILGWTAPASDMPEDMFYVVDIRKSVNGNLIGESRNWTKSTRIKLDPSFYTAFQDIPGRVQVAAPVLQAPTSQFDWSVAVYRLTLINPDGTLQGTQVSPSSTSRMFLWGPAPVEAPTRVYGGMSMESDPFFSEEQRREASTAGVLTPTSAGMGGLSLVLGAIIGATRFKSRARKDKPRARL